MYLFFSVRQLLVPSSLKMADVGAAETYRVLTNVNIRPQPNSLENMPYSYDNPAVRVCVHHFYKL